MPSNVIETDLENGLLAPLLFEDMPSKATLPLSSVYLTATPPGPAGRWLINRLKEDLGAAPY